LGGRFWGGLIGVEIIAIRGRKWGQILGVPGSLFWVPGASFGGRVWVTFYLRSGVEMGSDFGGPGGTFSGSWGRVSGVESGSNFIEIIENLSEEHSWGKGVLFGGGGDGFCLCFVTFRHYLSKLEHFFEEKSSVSPGKGHFFVLLLGELLSIGGGKIYRV
jgi:hypothetical protein